MSIKRFFCIVLSVMMVLAVIPTMSLAQGVSAAATEKAKLRLLDDVWADLEAVEAEVMASGAKMNEVVLAVYNAAVNDPRVDKGSFTDVSESAFFFKVDGMCNAYYYAARNVPYVSAVNGEMLSAARETVAKINAAKTGPSSLDVLLVGPQYKEDLTQAGYYDSSFTDQYMTEAYSIGMASGGDTVILGGHNATGPAIAEAYVDAGIVIYDSHGTAGNGTSYLCLTTDQGITSTDYNNGWAVHSGSEAYIDGRYIQNHVPGTLQNCIVWMAICQGMKASGNGTTGTALLNAGAGVVYGYSQSVTFAGDYLMEATFWNDMKDGATVAEAFAHMVSAHCPNGYDPYGNSHAYPIVMSPVDPFPANPDARQTVYSDWTIFGGSMEPVALESWSLSDESIEMLVGTTQSVRFNTIPDNANVYELVWYSMNDEVAAVSGNNKRVNITGVSVGSTTIYCEVKVDGNTIGTAYCNVVVNYDVALSEAAQADGCDLQFSSSSTYPWEPVSIDGRNAAKSGNAGVSSSSSSMYLVLNMQSGETMSFDWKVSSENNYDYLNFYVNGNLYGNRICGTTNWATVTYTADADGTYTFEWSYTKDTSVNSGNDCGYVDNVYYVSSTPEPEPIPGDVNDDGAVDSVDALLALRYSMQMQDLTAEELERADINGDGVVDATDALLILRLSMNIGGR